jgi:cephalosporin hydroxylase
VNFNKQIEDRISAIDKNDELKSAAHDFMKSSLLPMYSYNFKWMGRPIIQYPQDMMAMQELIWDVRPDLIIETGIAHGGSLIMNASFLAMLDYCDAIENGESLNPNKPKRRVLGIDIDIREHNRKAIEAHPMSNRIDMIQGSSIAEGIINQVKAYAKNYKHILVSLDSNHTHEHVLEELRAYAPLTSLGSYCVVFDTLIEKLPKESYPNRPWGPGNSPGSAVKTFLSKRNDFIVDTLIDGKLLISSNGGGYLRRVG